MNTRRRLVAFLFALLAGSNCISAGGPPIRRSRLPGLTDQTSDDPSKPSSLEVDLLLHENTRLAARLDQAENIIAQLQAQLARAIDSSKLSTDLAAFVSAINLIKSARAAVDADADVPLNLDKIRSDFEAAMSRLDQKEPDELASELLMIGLMTVKKADLVDARPGRLVRLLMIDFVLRLDVGDLWDLSRVVRAKKGTFTDGPPRMREMLENMVKFSASKFKARLFSN